jgi:hypothetical protein
VKTLALLALAAASCGPPPPPGVTTLDDTSDFFGRPWPSDTRLVTGADGKKHLDLTGFYNPGAAIGAYIAAIGDEPLGGFGTSSAIYFRFDGPLDPTTLPPAPAASIADGATVSVVDVTQGSPTLGKRSPLRIQFSTTAGMYIGANALALLPEPGFPLRERTTYTAVITDGVRAADGGSVHRAAGFQPPAVPGVDAATIVAATTFTTQDATTIMKDLRDAVYAQAPAPTASAITWTGEKTSVYDEFEGTYPSPNFQEGDPPYSRVGGHIHLGADGKPLVVRTEQLRFALTVPKTPMPQAGYPVVLYAHGTGGDYRSFIDDGSAASAAIVKDDKGNVIANLAMISIDQVLHGPRDPTGASPEITFFNFQNIAAARDNPKQGALDDYQLIRMVEGFNVAMAPMTGQPIKFDKTRIYFKGHSQGGLTGPLYLAYEPKIKGAILSGAGANFILALLGKTAPNDIPKVVAAIVGEPVDAFHPLINLLQAYLESSDPGNYGRLYLREPPAGLDPKNIYQSLGLVDHFTPVPTIKAFALSMGLTPANPELDPIDDLPLTSQTWLDAPLQSNLANGAATGVLCEYQVPTNSKGIQAYDGHFVVFKHSGAVFQANGFLGTHARTGIARLLP